MTPKELEHFLIDNDFDYQSDPFFSFWKNKKKDIAISDNEVQENPVAALQFLKKVLATR